MLDRDVFAKMLQDEAAPKRVEILSQMTDVDPLLMGTHFLLPCGGGISTDTSLGRLLKHVATANVVAETNADEYAPTEVSRVLATPAAAGAFLNMFVIVNRHFLIAP